MFRPMVRKSYHRKSSNSRGDAAREAGKPEAEETKRNCGGGESSSWVPHPRTGIYYPQGHEKVMEDVPAAAAKDFPVHWLSHRH